jgi:hypothetical protein
MRRGHEQGDVATQHLGGSIAEGPLGGGVEGIDDAVLVDGDDAVDRGIDDGADTRRALAQLGGLRRERLLGALALPDLAADAHEQQ